MQSKKGKCNKLYAKSGQPSDLWSLAVDRSFEKPREIFSKTSSTGQPVGGGEVIAKIKRFQTNRNVSLLYILYTFSILLLLTLVLWNELIKKQKLSQSLCKSINPPQLAERQRLKCFILSWRIENWMMEQFNYLKPFRTLIFWWTLGQCWCGWMVQHILK